MVKTKTSRVTTWLLRGLIVFIVLICIGLLMLSAVSGTSESHRRGLEQAFSDFLKADVRMGRLAEFNILPQLRFAADDVKVTSRDSLQAYQIGHIKLAFGFWDLLLQRRTIEIFEMKDFHFSVGPEFGIDTMSILPGKPILETKGAYRDKGFSLNLELQKKWGQRPSYFFASANKLTGTYGSLDFSGMFIPNERDRKTLRDIAIFYQGQALLKGQGGFDANNNFRLDLACMKENLPAPAKADLQTLEKSGALKISGNCDK